MVEDFKEEATTSSGYIPDFIVFVFCFSSPVFAGKLTSSLQQNIDLNFFFFFWECDQLPYWQKDALRLFNLKLWLLQCF